ncbi:hypothetical protein DERP_012410 [Dermatophagoides pteronyssinus]|uniref:Uncharacterized protein n=1 Tax=Dermatophagoides pteronyssinus TaxID=6956 RepID=A0ABQ8IUN5_DERPT|nr:hypothetical protein DERP_012410 [Dermatophagoides pteronyssinus]
MLPISSIELISTDSTGFCCSGLPVETTNFSCSSDLSNGTISACSIITSVPSGFIDFSRSSTISFSTILTISSFSSVIGLRTIFILVLPSSKLSIIIDLSAGLSIISIVPSVFLSPSGVSSISSIVSATSKTSTNSVIGVTPSVTSSPGVSSISSIVSTTSKTLTNSVIGVTPSVTSPGFGILRMIFFGFFVSSTIT